MDQELKISNLIFHFGSLTFAYFFSKNIYENIKLSFLSTFFLFLLIISIFLQQKDQTF